MPGAQRSDVCVTAGYSAVRLLAIGLFTLQVGVGAFAANTPQPAPNRVLARVHFVSAQKALAAGDSATARAKLNLALQADSKYAEAYLLLGLVDFQRGETVSAIQHYKKALAL